MANQTIPITLSWGAVSTDVRADNINQLGTLIAQQLSASLRAEVTFIPVVTNDPVSFTSQLIFNVTQSIFKSWNIGAGAYRAVTENIIGDVKNTFIGNDTIPTGWVILNGRKISEIVGLSATQISNLQTLFGTGVNQTIPIVTPANLNGLPQGTPFSDIIWPEILPASGAFSGQTFSNPVTQAQGEALAGNTETLRATANNIFEFCKQLQSLCQTQLNALNNANTPTLYSAVFCGYP